MAYFDKDKNTEVVTDASPFGLSAILSQHTPGLNDRKIVAYVSRSLTSVEQKYSQTEKEALAIVWAIERLHIYLYGGHFTLVTDCKPLQWIFKNPKSKPPARIERWSLRLQEYSFSVKGSENPSDYLSRHPSQETVKILEKAAEQYVNFISCHTVPKAMSLAEIKEATVKDKTLQLLVQCIRTGKWELVESSCNIMELKQFKQICNELTVNADSNLILKGARILLPTSLRKKAIELAHEGHQGLVKTKQLIREKVWFPGIDKEVNTMIGNCIICQANGPKSNHSPLQMSELPPTPWHTVNVDFCGPFPTGEYLLVVIDAYSRFPEVEIVHSTSARGTIDKLERIFGTHGIPNVLKSDNGPPFSSGEFKAFIEHYGIKHKRVTPLWPQANAEAENFMKPITKAVRSSHAEGKDWKKEINIFLLNYRATPHCTTKVSPAQLLFNRVIRTKLPSVVGSKMDDHELRERDKKEKERMKEYADRRRRAKTSQIQIGDTVLVQQKKVNKFSSKFDPVPFKVIGIKGTMITVVRNGKYLSRNVAMLKKVNTKQMSESVVESDYDDDEQIGQEQENERENDDGITNPQGVDNTERQESQSRYPTRIRRPVRRYGQNIYEQ